MSARAARAFAAATFSVALLATSGCGLLRPGDGVTAVEVPEGPAGITGAIVGIEPGSPESDGGSMLVEGGTQPAGAVSDKAMVAFDEDTLVARAGRWISVDDLAVGMNVRVWFDGAVAESYPVQGSASFIAVE